MKINFCLVLFLIFFMLLWVVFYSQVKNLRPRPVGPVDYDHIQMVHTWVPTFCKEQTDCRIRSDTFTLHGLWPAKASGKTVGPCQNTCPYLAEVYQELGPPLQEAWPALNSSWINNEKFWDHEWKKHGNCSSNVLPPFNYFNSGIIQTNKIKIQVMLETAGILPGVNDSYKQSAIEEAIKDGISSSNRLNIYVSCWMEESTGDYYLKEIYICLDKTASSYFSCPDSNRTRSCPQPKDKKEIKYITADSTSIKQPEPTHSEL